MIDCVIKSWDLFPVGGVSSRAWKLNLSKICVKRNMLKVSLMRSNYSGEKKKKMREKKNLRLLLVEKERHYCALGLYTRIIIQ